VIKGSLHLRLSSGSAAIPWYCSKWPVYVTLEFSVTQPIKLPYAVDPGALKKIQRYDLELVPGEADVLQKMQSVSNGEGCL
jgi:hypothetical protein